MSERSELIAFCERKEGSLDILSTQSYVAGFRRSDGATAVEITLPVETVERPVLTGARLALWLSLDGRLVLDGEGLSDEMLEAASAAGEHQPIKAAKRCRQRRQMPAGLIAEELDRLCGRWLCRSCQEILHVAAQSGNAEQTRFLIEQPLHTLDAHALLGE